MIMPQLIINTCISLKYELKKNWKGTDDLICWDRALVLWKKNLAGRGLTKVEKQWSRPFTEEKNLLLLSTVAPRFFGCSPCNVVTVVAWLLRFFVMNMIFKELHFNLKTSV